MPFRWRFVLIALAVVLPLLAAACSAKETEGAENTVAPGTIAVVATTGMIADLARRIAGDAATVKTLMGPGTDPHLYKAREKDVRLLAHADVVLYNGLHLEGKLGDVLKILAKRKPVAAVTEAIDHASLRFPESFAGNPDPHVWFDVTLWMKAAERIRDALIERGPAKKEMFTANAAALLAELGELHAWCKSELAGIPKERRVLVTAHDAFGYFGRAYDVEVRGIQGISTEDEAGVKEVNDLVELLAQRGIKAVFVESSVPKKNIEALVEGCRARGHAMRVGGELYSDAMGAEGTPEGTYIGMVRHNVRTIVAALK
ncbi:MAG: manganese transporter [Myxococcales bacterium]|nr:MAG: manganese transporter [Myxococcales bacterium]